MGKFKLVTKKEVYFGIQQKKLILKWT